MNIKAKVLLGCIMSYMLTSVAYAQKEVNTAMTYEGGTVVADNIYFDAVKEMMHGRSSKAEDLFLEFLKIRPDEPAAYYELSRISVELNKADKSEDYIKKAIALDSNNKWYVEQYIAVLVNRSDFADAAKELDKLASKEKRNRDYLLNASLLYQKAGKDVEALAVLNRAMAKGYDEDVLVRKQQIFAKLRNVDSVTATIELLISLDPKEAKYYTLLAETYDNNKQPEKAKQVYEKALNNVPDDPGLQLSLAEHYSKIGDTIQFNAYLRKAITNREIDVRTQLELLYSYIRTLPGEEEKAKQGRLMMMQILAQHPNDAQALAAYGDILVLNKQPDSAVEQYKKSIAIDPSKILVWEQVLRGYSDAAHADSLILYSKKALRLFPNQAQIHFMQSIGYMNKKDYVEAIKSVNRAIDMQPEEDSTELLQMYSLLGDLYNNTKQYTLSDSAFEHALRINANDVGVLNNYAYYLSVRNVRLADAERMSARTLQMRPDFPIYLDTYGWILYQQGKYEKAKPYIEKAINKDPNADGTVWEHLGDVNYKLGDVNKAVECWKVAKDKKTDNPLIDKKISEKKLYE